MILEVNAVSKSFQQGSTRIEVLKSLSLHVKKGEKIAILGQSGSGKSTLLSLLAGLDKPTSGSINIAGQNLGAFDEAGLTAFRARHLGIVFQQFHLMSNLTAFENVSLPLEITRQGDIATKAREALERVGLAARAGHFPATLSGGEKQRVAIARALVVRPSLLLADEPSGNLDTETGETTMNLLFKVAADTGMTMLLVTHNTDLAKRCDKILELKAGALHERTY